MQQNWWRLTLVFALIVTIPASVQAADEAVFEKSLAHTRAVIEKHHLVSLVEIEPLDGGKKTEFRYDRYPEVERIQLPDGSTFARKKGKSWLKSTDWAKTGSKLKPAKAEELDALVSFVDAPLQNHTVSKDKSQGGTQVHLVKREPRDNGERQFYEIRREKASGFLYPQFVFDKGKGAPDEEALLVGYGGLMYSGDEKVRVNINFDYLFAVKMEIVNAGGNAEAKTSLPKPESDRIYSFNELEQQKFALKGKVVRLQVTPKVLQSEELEDGNSRLMLKDTAKPQAFYGLVDIPKIGLEKLGLDDQSAKENLTFYILVTPRSKEEVAKFTALGRSFSKDAAGKTVYSW